MALTTTTRNLALLLLYWLIVVPAGSAARLVRDPLHRVVDRDAESYWIDTRRTHA
ncbi:hypothetical protein SAMN04487983_1002316 [Streptomyces sp. yr375]|uniref:hypothetical protein n=1 Tax=Streptomyces sp. yr375 TaxID=1761906 RepID=UPI0008D18B62|nr:hypothetical protein [Streptomyces sp. yr375]SEP97733.1 hypothetical protein SAMN04487983_1002316 [Streptomyces sp. yr375]